MAKAKKVRKSIGVLWIRSTGAGEGYYRGYLDFEDRKIPVVAFDNSMQKLHEKSPDVRIYIHEPLKA